MLSVSPLHQVLRIIVQVVGAHVLRPHRGVLVQAPVFEEHRTRVVVQ